MDEDINIDTPCSVAFIVITAVLVLMMIALLYVVLVSKCDEINTISHVIAKETDGAGNYFIVIQVMNGDVERVSVDAETYYTQTASDTLYGACRNVLGMITDYKIKPVEGR